MADVVGSATIELVADARKLRAGIDEAKRAIRTLPEGQKDITAGASRSIDNYIGKLQAQNLLLGKSARETELFKLAQRGASNEQINAANAALLVNERYEKIAAVSASVRTGLLLIAGAAATAAAAFAAVANRNIDFADKLGDLSKSTGISVEDLAGLSLLARQSGTDVDSLAKAVNKLSVEMGKAPEEFEELGITAKDGLGALKQFADIIVAIPDLQERNTLANKVLNKSWQEMAAVLSEGGNRIQEVVDRGRKLSGITTEIQQQADQFKDKLEELKTLGSALGTSMLPSLNNIASAMLRAAEEGDSWLGKLQEGAKQAFIELTRLNNVGDLNRVNKEIAFFADKLFELENPQNRGPERVIALIRRELEHLREKRAILEGIGTLDTEAAKKAAEISKAEAASRQASKETQERVRRFNEEKDRQAQTARQIFAIQEDFAEKTIALEVATTQARLASTANLVATQRELEQSELSAITRRAAAAKAAAEAEMAIAKTRSKTAEEAIQGQLAAGKKGYDALIAADIAYLNIVKRNREKIVALEDELVQSRRRTADFIKGIDEAGFTPDQKARAAFTDSVEVEGRLLTAVLTGNVKLQKELTAEAERTKEALRGTGQDVAAIRHAERIQELTELGISTQTQAAQAGIKASETASERIKKDIAEVTAKVDELQKTGLNNFTLKASEESLKGIVDSVKRVLESEKFKVSIQAEVIRNGSSFSDVGSTPRSRIDQFNNDVEVSGAGT